jgi:hypothetical protein
MPHRAERRASLWRRAELDPFKVVVAIIVFGSALYLAWFSFDNRRISECQTEYNTRVAEVTNRRAQIAQEDRISLVTLIRRVTETTNRQRSRAAVVEYLQTQDELDRKRRANPIPKLPEGACQ